MYHISICVCIYFTSAWLKLCIKIWTCASAQKAYPETCWVWEVYIRERGEGENETKRTNFLHRLWMGLPGCSRVNISVLQFVSLCQSGCCWNVFCKGGGVTERVFWTGTMSVSKRVKRGRFPKIKLPILSRAGQKAKEKVLGAVCKEYHALWQSLRESEGRTLRQGTVAPGSGRSVLLLLWAWLFHLESR